MLSCSRVGFISVNSAANNGVDGKGTLSVEFVLSQDFHGLFIPFLLAALVRQD